MLMSRVVRVRVLFPTRTLACATLPTKFFTASRLIAHIDIMKISQGMWNETPNPMYISQT